MFPPHRHNEHIAKFVRAKRSWNRLAHRKRHQLFKWPRFSMLRMAQQYSILAEWTSRICGVNIESSGIPHHGYFFSVNGGN